MSADKNPRLSEEERRKIRKLLQSIDSKSQGRITRIGRAVIRSLEGVGDVKRYRFGVGMIMLAIFQMLVVATLPMDDRRWLFFAFAWLTLFVGAWQIDKARPK